MLTGENNRRFHSLTKVQTSEVYQSKVDKLLFILWQIEEFLPLFPLGHLLILSLQMRPLGRCGMGISLTKLGTCLGVCIINHFNSENTGAVSRIDYVVKYV